MIDKTGSAEKSGYIYKNMRLFSPFLFIILFSSKSFCQTKDFQFIDSLFATVDLQKGFDDDLVKMKINGCSVLKNLLVSTHPLTDFTGISLEINSTGNVLVVFFNEKKYHIKIPRDKLIVRITVNEKRNKFRIDLSKGKHIGFNKIGGNKLVVRQLTRKFYYD